MRIGAAALVFLLIVPAAERVWAAQSVYTGLNFDNGDCKPADAASSKEDEEQGNSSFVCSGYKGYLVEYDRGDERSTVHYGDPSAVTTAHGWESFVGFNSPVDRFEWRIDGKGVPYAAIHRFLIVFGEQDGPDIKPGNSGQVLVISKVGQPNGPAGCVVGLVDALANAGANDMARNIADQMAPGFICGKDKAVYHGRRGEKASDFTVSFHP